MSTTLCMTAIAIKTFSTTIKCCVGIKSFSEFFSRKEYWPNQLNRHLQNSCRAIDFSHEWDKMVHYFIKTESFCYKNLSFIPPNFLKDLSKSWLDFVHFAGAKVNKTKARVHLCSKGPFHHPTRTYIYWKCMRVLLTVKPNLAESFCLSRTRKYFVVFNETGQTWMQFHDILQNFTV